MHADAAALIRGRLLPARSPADMAILIAGVHTGSNVVHLCDRVGLDSSLARSPWR